MANLTQEQAREKIKALLNMTTDRGCTEAEATSAAERASRIALQYNVDMANLAEEEQARYEDILIEREDIVRPGGWRWQSKLASAIARTNGCRTVLDRRVKGKGYTSINFIGTDFNVMIAQQMFGYMRNTFLFLVTQETIDVKAAVGVTGRAFTKAFLHGVTDRVTQRLREEHEQDIKNMNAGAYLTHMSGLVNMFTQEMFPNLRVGSAQGKLSNNDGYARGQERGNNVILRERPALGK